MDASDTNWVHFTRTHWSVVLSAKGADSPERQRALDLLCQSYWPPIYAYIRQRGYGPQDAQDLTQEFFARLLRDDLFQNVTQTKGKFRSFLLACVNHLLSHEHDKQRALKRGGNSTHITLEEFQSVDSELLEKGPVADWDQNFDRLWARTVLLRASRRLETMYRARGKAALFEALKGLAPGSDQQSAYESVASQLGMKADALRAAVHRMRVRMGRLIREEVRQTLTDPADVETEIRYLIDVISKCQL